MKRIMLTLLLVATTALADDFSSDIVEHDGIMPYVEAVPPPGWFRYHPLVDSPPIFTPTSIEYEIDRHREFRVSYYIVKYRVVEELVLIEIVTKMVVERVVDPESGYRLIDVPLGTFKEYFFRPLPDSISSSIQLAR